MSTDYGRDGVLEICGTGVRVVTKCDAAADAGLTNGEKNGGTEGCWW